MFMYHARSADLDLHVHVDTHEEGKKRCWKFAMISDELNKL